MCTSTNPCNQPNCSSCTDASVHVNINQIDAAKVFYHLDNSKASQLSCLELPNGITLEQLVEQVDQAICEKGNPEVSALNLGCLVNNTTPTPTSFQGVIELIAATLCQVQSSTVLTNLISNLLGNTSTFISSLLSDSRFITAFLANTNLVQQLAGNATFITALLGNTTFTNGLAGNNSFITALFQSTSFSTALFNKLLQSSSFLTSLANALTSDSTLKNKFCCGTTSPCAGMVVNGVTLTDCGCLAPYGLSLTGSDSLAPNTNGVYTLAYAGTPGIVTFGVTSGLTLISNTNATATVRGAGTLTAFVTGCDGNTYTAQKTVTSTSTCLPVAGLGITGSLSPYANQAVTYGVTTLVTGGTVLTYQWTVTGGTINGSSTASSVSVNWGSAGSGSIALTITDCSGTPQTISHAVAIGAACLSSVSISGPTSAAPTSSSYTAQVTGSGSGFTYQWVVNGGSIVGSDTGQTVSISWTLANGSVGVTVSGCGTSVSNTANVSTSVVSSGSDFFNTQDASGETLTEYDVPPSS